MKKLSLIVFLLALIPSALADGCMMGDYGIMSGGFFGMGFLWLIGVALASFIFSIIFWFCYKWIVEDKKRKR